MKEYLQEDADVLLSLHSDAKSGLSQTEAASRLEKNGLNKLKEAERTPLWKRFLAQMADPMIIMLIVAAVISALVGVAQGEADYADVIIICFVVVVNAVSASSRSPRPRRPSPALQEMSASMSKVVRDGQMVLGAFGRARRGRYRDPRGR